MEADAIECMLAVRAHGDMTNAVGNVGLVVRLRFDRMASCANPLALLVVMVLPGRPDVFARGGIDGHVFCHQALNAEASPNRQTILRTYI